MELCNWLCLHPHVEYANDILHLHNIIKQCAFIHVGPENINVGCPTLVEETHIKS